jgi:hypothetical protein
VIQSSETSALLRVYIQRRQSTRSLGGWHSFRARQPRRAHIIFADMCTRLFSRRRLAPLSMNRSSPNSRVGRPCLSADDLRQAAAKCVAAINCEKVSSSSLVSHSGRRVSNFHIDNWKGMTSFSALFSPYRAFQIETNSVASPVLYSCQDHGHIPHH